MIPPILAILALLPFVVFPLLAAAAAGLLPRARLPDRRRLALALVVVLWASLHAYVRSDDKPGPPEPPPEPPPGPYVPGSEWQCILHHDPFTGRTERRWEYRLPPSHPEVPVEKERPQ